MHLPSWIHSLRRSEVVDRIDHDPRTSADHPLGVHRDRVFNEVIGGGQADFAAPWGPLSPDDRALLYAYMNQKGHVLELLSAFRMLLARSGGLRSPVVLDLGCGPFTAGLAISDVLGGGTPWTYVGVDRAESMRTLGERLARAAPPHGYAASVERIWRPSVADVEWKSAPSWRPVIIVASYLLASPTLSVDELVSQTVELLDTIGRGPVTLLYTNSQYDGPNRNFPNFRRALEAHGFSVVADDQGEVRVAEFRGERLRKLRYALFQRQARDVLNIGGS